MLNVKFKNGRLVHVHEKKDRYTFLLDDDKNQEVQMTIPANLLNGTELGMYDLVEVDADCKLTSWQVKNHMQDEEGKPFSYDQSVMKLTAEKLKIAVATV